MSDLTIYNCHCHTFTTRHVPRDFLKLLLGPVAGPAASALLSWQPAADALLWLARHLDPFSQNDVFERQTVLFAIGNTLTQREVFEGLEKQYPSDTVFVVLPMDLTFFNLGPVAEPIDWQHADLLGLAAEYPGRILPFYAVDPRHPDGLKRARQNLVPGKFHGVKLYPNAGYSPADDKLLGIYALCEERGLPVMAHCSPIGVWRYGLTAADRVAFSHPRNYEAILARFPQLRLCLAHFGGSEEWNKHLQSQTVRAGPGRDWVRWIADLIRDGAYPNLYTDISYTLFQTPGRDTLRVAGYLDYLKVLLADARLRAHVLFGSDYYMVKREPLTEKEISILLRSRLGEDMYFQIAHHNPRRYLGLE